MYGSEQHDREVKRVYRKIAVPMHLFDHTCNVRRSHPGLSTSGAIEKLVVEHHKANGTAYEKYKQVRWWPPRLAPTAP